MAKNKYSIHRKKSALQEKCLCLEQLLSMVLGDSDATSENQTIDVTIKETNRLYENLHEKFDDLKTSLTESQRLRREHSKQISSLPLTSRQILSALKNAKIFDFEHSDEEHIISSLLEIIPTLLEVVKMKEDGLTNLQKKKSLYAERIFDLQEIAKQIGKNDNELCRHFQQLLGLLCDFPEEPVSVHFTKLHHSSQKSLAANALLRRDNGLKLSIGGDATIEANESENNIC